MNCLSSFPFTKSCILSSLSNNNSPSPHTHTNQQSDLKNKSKQLKQKQRKLTVVEIERVIGAGVFRDRDITNRDSEESKSLLDSMLSNSIGKKEGKVERKLRETGEWLIDGTQNTSNSAGKKILVAMFLWLLPLWILSFAVASGIIRLPFSSQYLDDLFM